MDPKFDYLTNDDFNLSSYCHPLFDPRLATLAYKKILQYLKEGLSSFPELHSKEDEPVHVDSSSDEEDDSNKQHASNKKNGSKESHYSAETFKFIQNARKLLDAARGPYGGTVRSRIFTELENSFYFQNKFVEIKYSVLLSILGHEDFIQLSLSLRDSRLVESERRLFATIASKCSNLKELTIDVGRSNDCEKAYFWKPLENLTSLESLTLIGSKLPSNLSLGLKLKTLKFLEIDDPTFSSYNLCATLLGLEFKDVANVLASWWASNRKERSFTIEELLQCADNKTCLLPLCQSLTSLTVEKRKSKFYHTSESSFWQPASAAFLLLACPNLKELHTTDSFPHDKALDLINGRKEASLKTFNLTQMYVVVQHKENVRAMLQAHPHCRELIIQGLTGEDNWSRPDYKTKPREWLQGLMDIIGEKASTLSVTFRSFGTIVMEDLRGLSSVGELRLEGYSMHLEYDDKAKAVPLGKEPIFKQLRKLTIAGCLNRRDMGQRALLLECPNLEELYIQCIHFCTSGRKLVEFGREHLKNLKVLFIKTMEEVMWDSFDMIALFKACPNLHTLVLPNFVVRCFQKENFGLLHAFAEKRGAKVRYVAEDECEPKCEKKARDDYY